ncbi:unnamed protein product [Linum tenue]|nr:unnamed protein product [Linum tenue]
MNLREALTTVAALLLPALILICKWLFRRRRRSSNNNPQLSESTCIVDSSASTTGSDASLPLPTGDYEVFLSFRGPDTRHEITDVLYHFLIRSKIRTFKHDEDLHVDEGIWPSLVEAMKESRIYVPILSETYAESKWCLKELAEMVEYRKQDKGRIILPIFYKVNPRDVRKQSGAYEEAFKRHMKNFDDKTLQIWKDALKDVGELKGWHVTDKDGIRKIVGGSIGILQGLRELNISSCKCENLGQVLFDIVTLPSLKILRAIKVKEENALELPKSLKELSTSVSVSNLPELTNLEQFTFEYCEDSKLEISGTGEEWSKLSKLTSLVVKYGTNITTIGPLSLPPSLTELHISVCPKLERLPKLDNLENLAELILYRCSKLREIEGLGGTLKSLQSLKIDYCESLIHINGLEDLVSLTDLHFESLYALERPHHQSSFSEQAE